MEGGSANGSIPKEAHISLSDPAMQYEDLAVLDAGIDYHSSAASNEEESGSASNSNSYGREGSDLRPTVSDDGIAMIPIDDFIRNFFIRKGLTNSLSAFNTEWFERANASGEHIPNVYAENQLLEDNISQLKSELAHAKSVSASAQQTHNSLVKERDFHRMHLKRVVQEKNKLISSLKALKVHCESYESLLNDAKQKYEIAVREKMLATLERDSMQSQLKKAIAKLNQFDGENDEIAELNAKFDTFDGRSKSRVVDPTTSSRIRVTEASNPSAATGLRRSATQRPKRFSMGGSTRTSGPGAINTSITSVASGPRFPPTDPVNPYAAEGVAFEAAHGDSYGLVASVMGHGAAVSCLSHHPVEPLIVSGSDDRSWRLWRLSDTGNGAAPHPSNEISSSLGGQEVVSSSSSNSLKNKSYSQDDLPCTLDLGMTGAFHSSWLTSVDISPRGNNLATACGSGVLRLWDIGRASCISEVDEKQPIWALRWHWSSDFLAAAGLDKTAKLLDAHTGKSLKVFRGHADSVNALAWRPFSSTFATGSGDKTLCLWDARSGLSVQTLYGCSNALYGVTFSEDGNSLASADADGTVRLWDVRAGQEFARVRVGRFAVNSVAFDRSGTIVASACDDGYVRLYSTNQGRAGSAVVSNNSSEFPGAGLEEIAVLSDHMDSVQSVLFDPTSQYLVSAGRDKTVKVWSDRAVGALMEGE